MFLAQLLLSGEGDTLMALQSLIGAVGMTAFTYFLPYLLMIMLSDKPLPTWRLRWSWLNIGIGIGVMVCGLWTSVDALASSSAGFFAGLCKLEYAYAPESPHDPCYISGLPGDAG